MRGNLSDITPSAVDGWYGTIPEFRQELESHGESYVVGVYSSTSVFLEAPVLEIAPVKEQKRGRPRTRPDIVAVNPEPLKLSTLGERIEDDPWRCLELRCHSRDKPLRVEAVSLRVWPANGWRKGKQREQVWLLTMDLARLYHERTGSSRLPATQGRTRSGSP